MLLFLIEVNVKILIGKAYGISDEDNVHVLICKIHK